MSRITELPPHWQRLASNPPTLRQPNATHPDRKLPNPKPECHQTPALGRPAKGEKESLSRARVRFTGYRVRPLDPDNFAGSVKDLLDGCRHAGLIVGDEPWNIILETDQVCVRAYAQEKTVIEITIP